MALRTCGCPGRDGIALQGRGNFNEAANTQRCTGYVQVSPCTDCREGEVVLQILLHEQAQGDRLDTSLPCGAVQPIRSQI